MSGCLMLGYQKSAPAHPSPPKTAACIVGCTRAKTYAVVWAWLVGVAMISGTPA